MFIASHRYWRSEVVYLFALADFEFNSNTSADVKTRPLDLFNKVVKRWGCKDRTQRTLKTLSFLSYIYVNFIPCITYIIFMSFKSKVYIL